MMATSEKSGRIEFFAFAAFLALLAAPGLLTFADIADGPESARQEAFAPTPDMALSSGALGRMPGLIRAYMKTRYAFRDAMIAVNGAVITSVFGSSPNDSVVIGDGGFLFLSDKELIEHRQGLDLFSPDELSAWAGAQSGLAQRLEAVGVDYRFVLAPDKVGVYAEYAPTWLRASASDRNNADLVADTLRDAGVRVVDLRETMKAFRETAPARIYHKTDTHWNEFGAAHAAEAIAQSLGLNAAAMEPVTILAQRGGDLARLIGRTRAMKEEIVTFSAPVPRCVDQSGRAFPRNELDPVQERLIVCEGAQGDGVALVFIDSFGAALVPSLSRLFRKTVFAWSYEIDPALIEAIKPDVVLQEVVERKLRAMNPQSMIRSERSPASGETE